MSEKKHIDRLFHEKFKDFEVSPNENVWNNIENKLKGKKARKRFLIPLWYKIAGSAAMLAFLVWMGGWVFDNNPKPNQNIVAPTEVENPDFETKDEMVAMPEEPEIQENSIVITESVVSTEKGQNEKAEISENNSPESQKGNFISEKSASNPVWVTNQNAGLNPGNNTGKVVLERKSNSISSEEVFSENISVEETAQNEDEVVNKKSLLVYAEEQESEKNKDFEEEVGKTLSQNKWQVQTFAAPVYYRGGNSIDPKFASNSNESDITMAYGVNVAYQISDKIRIRSGIGQVKMSNNIQKVAFASAVEPTALKNVNYNSQSTSLRIENFSTINNYFPDGEIQGRPLPYSTGTLNQQMGFIEVPFEIEYALIDKKFGLSIIGGGSTLFLNENKISINSADGTTNIGKANNLNKTSFSTNIGLGMDYELSKRFELSLEPIFKYQLNTFSKDMDFNPYYFGVFTGISFKF